MRRPSLPYELLAAFARARAERASELSSGTKRIMFMTPPRDPTQVPDGDLSDAVKPGNPTPSDFNDDEADEESFDDGDDDTYDDGEDDED